MAAGGALINAVFPPPGLPNSATAQQGSTTYSLQAQGNVARLGGPIPVNYGRMRIYPDFAAQPYTEYESNEQYLYQLFCIGQGENRISDIRLEDTPVENFEEVTLEIVPPLGKVTLFHTAVVTAPEAGGQDLSEPATYGPYIINATGTEISRAACDVVFPGGLIGVDEDDGDEYSVGVELNIRVEPVDDAGDISGGPITVFNDWIVDHTRTAIRRTLAKDVPPGRYQMTIQRLTGKGGNSEVRNCQLGAVKGYLVDDNEYGDVTLLAMRVRATANLSDSASRLVNVLNERLIPVWDPDNGWSTPVITRNPSWAFADAVRSRYGGDFPDDQIDLNGLHYLAGLFDSRGDRFDGRFDTDQSLWDGLGKIGQVCRCGPVRHGNLIRLIRDQQVDTPVQQFSMANMSEFSLDYVMHNARTADSVKVTFWDEDRDYAETTILCQLPDDNADIPQDVTLFGCTQYEQAWREGMYLAASNRERRQMVSWKTEMEGHIPGFGDLVWINHDLLGAGQLFSGTVSSVDGAVLTLSRDVEMTGGNWYIILRDRLGQPSSPLACEVAGSHQVRVFDPLPFIETDPIREPTHFMIGQGKAVSWPVKVTAITPEADDRVTIAGCIESEFVHTADEGEVPPPPPAIVPPPPGLDIEDLRATQGGTVSQPVVYLSWAFASGADRYLIEYSRDGRQTWQPAGTGQSLVNNHEFTSEPGLITCRVAAVAAVRGDWAQVDVNAGGDFAIPGKVQPRLAEPFTGNTLKIIWDKEPAAARYLVEVLSGGTRARAVYVDRTVTTYGYDYTDAQRDGAGRTLMVKVLAQNAEGVSGPAGELTATNPPPAVPDQIVIDEFIDAFAVRVSPSGEPDIRELRVWGSQASGFSPDAGTLQGTSTTTRIDINQQGTWYFRVAWVDNWGTTGLNYSGEIKATSGTVDFSDWFPVEETNISDDAISTPKLQANVVEADKIAANAVTAEKISVNNLSAISANMGTLTAGTMKTDAATGARVEITSVGSLPFWIGSGSISKANAHLYFDASSEILYSDRMQASRMQATDMDCTRGNFVDVTVRGTIYGEHGEFNGTVFADNIEGDVVSFASAYLSDQNYGEGIPSKTWHTIATITMSSTAGWDRFLSVDALQIYQKNCGYDIRLRDNASEEIWKASHNTTIEDTRIIMPYGTLKAGRKSVLVQIYRHTTSGTNYLQVKSGSLRCFVGKSQDMSITVS